MSMKKRNKLFDKQGGLCYYCESPMWILRSSKSTKKPVIKGFKRKYSIDHHHAEKLRCTIEHKVCKAHGGGNGLYNLVAACLHCNSVRKDWGGNVSPTEYKRLVQRRMKRGTWFAQFNPLTKFNYRYSPSLIDVVVGMFSRSLWFNKSWAKHLKRRYRSYCPQQMSKVQMLQSFIRAHT